MSYFLPVWQGMTEVLPGLLWPLWSFKHGRKEFEIASAYWGEFYRIWLNFGQQCLKTEFLKFFSEITVSFHWIFLLGAKLGKKSQCVPDFFSFQSYYQQDTVSLSRQLPFIRWGVGRHRSCSWSFFGDRRILIPDTAVFIIHWGFCSRKVVLEGRSVCVVLCFIYFWKSLSSLAF